MSRYLQFIEQTEKWRGRSTDRHIIDSFISRYDVIYDSDDHVPDPDALASAFGLYRYFSGKGIKAQIIYSGKFKIRKSNLI